MMRMRPTMIKHSGQFLKHNESYINMKYVVKITKQKGLWDDVDQFDIITQLGPTTIPTIVHKIKNKEAYEKLEKWLEKRKI